ncbi:MAG: glycosyltransferase family 2 protein [Sediminibacterium sp.]|jgi:glycosyltransferase involved in cell wall biosynthesis|nr:MAG: glycosyltransferase family 2 protein [Sediminibacterium sp.]
MTLSIIICSYNRASYIEAALDSLYNQSAGLQNFEAIIVDNNSTDNTADVFKNWRASHANGSFTYLTEPNQGASFARNTGATHAKGQWLCFMDDDAIANSNYVENIIKHIKTKPAVVGFGGRIIPKYIPSEPKWMSYYVSSLVGNFDYAPTACAFENGKYPLESNMIVRKDIYDFIGGFNTALPGVMGTLRIGGEGKELFYKILALGHTIYYDPSICVQHIVEVKKLTAEYMYRVASGIGRGEKTRTLSISKGSYLKKIMEYLFKLGAAFVLGFKYLLQCKPAKTWPVIQFRIDALKGLLG